MTTPAGAATLESNMDNKTEYFAHSKALVDAGATIGAHTRVWAFAHVMSGAKIGSHCNICDYAFVESGATLGNWVTIKNGVHIWEGVTIEDGVFLGPSCVFTNESTPRAFIKNPKEQWLKTTHIAQGASIGANATIVCGYRIGQFAFVAAGAVVTRDVPDFAMVLGNPARFHAWVCRCMNKLTFKAGKKETKCTKCGQAFVKTTKPAGIKPKAGKLTANP